MFPDTAVVYTPDPTTGALTVVANSALRGRLAVVTITSSGPNRAELVSARRWLWQGSYEIPNNAQLLVGTERWNVAANSQAAERGLSGQVIIRRADVERAT